MATPFANFLSSQIETEKWKKKIGSKGIRINVNRPSFNDRKCCSRETYVSRALVMITLAFDKFFVISFLIIDRPNSNVFARNGFPSSLRISVSFS